MRKKIGCQSNVPDQCHACVIRVTGQNNSHQRLVFGMNVNLWERVTEQNATISLHPQVKIVTK